MKGKISEAGQIGGKDTEAPTSGKKKENSSLGRPMVYIGFHRSRAKF